MWACPRGMDLRSRRLGLPDGLFLSAAMYEIPPPGVTFLSARRAKLDAPASAILPGGQVTGCITRTTWLLLSYGFFLARDGALGPTTCSCISAGALATHRQITAMAHAAHITSHFNHQAPDSWWNQRIASRMTWACFQPGWSA